MINFKIVTTEESENALLQFNTYASAREKLDRWIDDYQLCMSHCGLSSKGSSCFQHQIKNCRGICCGDEAIEAYNKRAAQAIAEYSFPHPSFVLFDRGRSEDEQAIILVENNQYKGYGYIDNSCQITTNEDFKNYNFCGYLLSRCQRHYPSVHENQTSGKWWSWNRVRP